LQPESARPLRADARRNAETLLAAARAAFAEHGAAASLDDIARRAGLGIGTLYRHFPTRQALLEEVFRDRLDTLRARAEELLDATSPSAALLAWLRTLVEHATTYRGLAASVMISMLDERTELFASCQAMRAAGLALLTRAQQAGEVRPDVGPSELLLLVYGVAWATEQVPGGAGQTDRLLALLMDGLRQPG
jgi:AcrR family transcriptional regulator